MKVTAHVVLVIRREHSSRKILEVAVDQVFFNSMSAFKYITFMNDMQKDYEYETHPKDFSMLELEKLMKEG